MVTILANLWSNVLGSVATHGSQRRKKMKVRTIIIGVAIISFAVGITIPTQNHTQPASAAVSDKYDGDCTGTETAGRCADKPLIDHSNCQYPDRWSNPVDGCDNSDPAVPECIKAFSTKAGGDACIAQFVAQNNQPSTAPATVSECGGR